MRAVDERVCYKDGRKVCPGDLLVAEGRHHLLIRMHYEGVPADVVDMPHDVVKGHVFGAEFGSDGGCTLGIRNEQGHHLSFSRIDNHAFHRRATRREWFKLIDTSIDIQNGSWYMTDHYHESSDRNIEASTSNGITDDLLESLMETDFQRWLDEPMYNNDGSIPENY